ncbi:Endomembrane protein 70-domain-containing protein [Dunaliella salina]|uniref:Transmembrane 9 superfamily member n=1 Tax=Dunaliella salina TaxID=3046 RepID=A0ABQ7GQP7_DUNSA|nr:Endomembrane protein 70-domain-containing protein [Dunaliella salina]|eukprot:KAF5836931.1 Endomembrane protein 70-domain-containing protein [Dunaliella salina]
MRVARALVLLALGAILAPGTLAYYVPGTYPNEYSVGELLNAHVNSLTSFETELPFEYYTMPFCKPADGVEERTKVVCQPKGSYGPLSAAEAKEMKTKIDEHYRINMLLDNLPVTVYDLLDTVSASDVGVPCHVCSIVVVLGRYESTLAAEALEARRRLSGAHDTDDEQQLLDGEQGVGQMLGSGAITRKLLEEAGAPAPADGDGPFYYMVVGFEVVPCSIKREAGQPIEDVACGYENENRFGPQEIEEGVDIVYTYDVHWQPSQIKWASRWDAYLRMPGGKGNSLDLKDEAGWKLVTGDVFRTPQKSRSLAVQVGSGVQIICTFVVTLGLATLGFLSPASRGALLTTTIVLFVCLAVLAGLASVYAWGAMERAYTGWPYVCAQVSIFYPGIVMTIFTVLNLIIYHTGTSGAVPLGMYASIVAVWFLISIPLTFAGGFMALSLPIPSNPVKTNQIPRHIPPPSAGAHPTLLFFVAGILPFGTIFIELYFAMTSLWLGYFYYLFGFVFIIGVLTVLVTVEMSVLCTYVQLRAEDYLWWWQSFYRGGSVAVYIAIYALGFLLSSLSTLAGTIPVLIYLSYMTILIVGVYLGLGTVGFAASYTFCKAIFASLKAD